MAPLLDDTELHSFIGGRPATVEQLRDRYARQIVGRSPDGSQRWLNWVVRERESGEAPGTVHATIAKQDGRAVAEVAWVISSPHQRRGFAREAATAMAAWLRQQGVDVVIAHVDPQHEASMAVARALGLAPTETVVDGEVRWEGRLCPDK